MHTGFLNLKIGSRCDPPCSCYSRGKSFIDHFFFQVIKCKCISTVRTANLFRWNTPIKKNIWLTKKGEEQRDSCSVCSASFPSRPLALSLFLCAAARSRRNPQSVISSEQSFIFNEHWQRWALGGGTTPATKAAVGDYGILNFCLSLFTELPTETRKLGNKNQTTLLGRTWNGPTLGGGFLPVFYLISFEKSMATT